jgi:hypothetical protein
LLTTVIDFLKNFLDPYERKARLTPMLVALVPVLVLLLVYTPIQLEFSVKSITGILLYSAACSALSVFARRAGKRVEEALKTEWGGWPTTLIFRHRDSTIDSMTKARIHSELSRMIPGTSAPTPAEELTDPSAADVVYLAWSEHLRKKARNDSKQFPHIFNENCAYGFCRNMYGLRTFVLWISLLAMGISLGMAFYHWHAAPQLFLTDLGCSLGILGFAVLWRLVVSRALVKQAAYDYAKRLLDDCLPSSVLPKAKRERKTKDKAK